MKKKFLFGGLVVVLAVTYPAVSYFHGVQLHSEVEQRVAKLNKYLHDDLALKIAIKANLEQSGIFASRYALSFKDTDGTEVPLLQNDIEHGPLPLSQLKKGQFKPVSYASTVSLIRNKSTEKWFKSVNNEKAQNTQGKPFLLEYTVGYDQQIRGQADFAGLILSPAGFNTSHQLIADVGASSLTFSFDKEFENWQIESYSNPVKANFLPENASLYQLAP